MTRLSRGRSLRAMSPTEDTPRTQGDGTMADEVKKAKLTEKAGKTRGKNPRDISYLAFDVSEKDSLPKTLAEFMEVTGTKSENEMLEYVIDGFNSAQYAAASDEIGEFINDSWDKDTQAQFRLAVRNYAKLTGLSIDDAVNLIKPGVEKAHLAKVNASKETPSA
jgi:hypothetical protein